MMYQNDVETQKLLAERIIKHKRTLKAMREEAETLVSRIGFQVVLEYASENGVLGLYRGLRGSILMIRTDAIREHHVVPTSQEPDLVNWVLAIGHFGDAIKLPETLTFVTPSLQPDRSEDE